MNNTNLATRILKEKYFRTTKPSSLSFPKKHSSGFWSGCTQGIKAIMEYALWDVGSGENIDIWTEPWVPNPTGGIFRIYGPRPLHSPTSVHHFSYLKLAPGILRSSSSSFPKLSLMPSLVFTSVLAAPHPHFTGLQPRMVNS